MKLATVRGKCVWIVMVMALVTASLVAAPILPRPPKLPDEIRCLTGIQRVTIAVDNLPPEMVASGVDKAKLLGVLRKRLIDAGYEIVEDARPRLVIQCFTVVDPSAPDAIGVTTLLGVNQDVHLKRMGEDMVLPVATVVTTAMGKRDNLIALSESEVARAADMFMAFVRQATQ